MENILLPIQESKKCLERVVLRGSSKKPMGLLHPPNRFLPVGYEEALNHGLSSVTIAMFRTLNKCHYEPLPMNNTQPEPDAESQLAREYLLPKVATFSSEVV